jgi:hypothetical protein
MACSGSALAFNLQYQVAEIRTRLSQSVRLAPVLDFDVRLEAVQLTAIIAA